jgi:hypothetical protein
VVLGKQIVIQILINQGQKKRKAGTCMSITGPKFLKKRLSGNLCPSSYTETDNLDLDIKACGHMYKISD